MHWNKLSSFSDNFHQLNFEGQILSSGRTEDGFISAMQTYTDIAVDNTGGTPQVQFLEHPFVGFNSGDYSAVLIGLGAQSVHLPTGVREGGGLWSVAAEDARRVGVGIDRRISDTENGGVADRCWILSPV